MLRMVREVFRAVVAIVPPLVAYTAFAAVPPDAVGASASGDFHDKPLCVLAVEPQMHLLSLAAPDAADAGTISIFLTGTPSVRAGDLIRLSRNGGDTESKVEVIEHGAKKCADLAAKANDHHKQHGGAPAGDHSTH